MAGKIYKTAQGVVIDMDQLRLVNERTVSVGNMGVNARGDRVNADGSIKEHRNDIMKKTYRSNAVVAGKGIINSKGEATDPSVAAQNSTSTKSAHTSPSRSAPPPRSAETTPTLLRGSLAQSVADTDVTTSDDPTGTDNSDLMSLSTTTRTITRI